MIDRFIKDASGAILFYLLANTRNTVAKRLYSSKPNWVLAKDMFGVGSTKGYEICRKAGVDPDRVTINWTDQTSDSEAA